MVAEISDQHESEWAAMGEVARLLGIGTAEMMALIESPQVCSLKFLTCEQRSV